MASLNVMLYNEKLISYGKYFVQHSLILGPDLILLVMGCMRARSEGHTLKVHMDRQLLVMPKLHYMR